MNSLVVTLLAVVVSMTRLAVADVFTSMADMESLLRAEKEVSRIVDRYIESEMRRLEQLRRFSKEYREHNEQATADIVQFVSNPINAYSLIKRLTRDWSYVKSMTKNSMAKELIKNITTQRQINRVNYPKQEDVTGAMMALLRLQDTYQLDAHDIANGVIMGKKNAEELSAHDCFELGRAAYNETDYYLALSWMQEALDRVHNENPPTAPITNILEYLSYVLYRQGNVKRALAMSKQLAAMDSKHPRAAENVKRYEDALLEEGLDNGNIDDLPPVVNRRRENNQNTTTYRVFQALCRGKVLTSPRERAKLYCYYKSDRPYLRLAPIKTEIVNFRPLAVIFRNVISDYEIAAIKTLAIPKLHRSMQYNSITGEPETTTDRISKSTWLSGKDYPVVARVEARVEMMTNLNQERYELLQIANYGLGGHFSPHCDFGRTDSNETLRSFEIRGRIATVLFYLSQPELGGATVFPEAKVAVFPTMHDALFWYNLHRSGDGDTRTLHAGCPVLMGNKWIANKWLYTTGQEFLRPCALNPDINELYVGDLGGPAPNVIVNKKKIKKQK